MFPKPEGIRLYRGTGTGGVRAGDFVSVRWPGVSALAAPGNWDRAGGNDFMVRDGLNHLLLYPGNNAGGFGTPRQIGNGWGGMSFIG
jgi:hypothetical protein